MAIKLKLEAQKRETKGKGAARKLRNSGQTPAIVYGAHNKNIPISFDTKGFLKLVHGEIHENMIFNINLDKKDKEAHNVIIKEMQIEPVKGTLLHVDFLEIEMDHTLQVHVPIEIKGDAYGVKEEGGLLDHVAREILIECLPNDLPEKIEIDVSELKLGESLHIKDISFPPGVKTVESTDRVLLTIIHKLKGRVEEVAEITEEEAEPEVLTKKTSEKESSD